MAIKQLKTRLALRTGDYAYWTTGAGKDIELYKGEVCVCTVATADKQATTAPTVLFKVANANGQKFADLNWVSGLAADVYAWAKKENPDWTDFPALPLTVVDNGPGKFVTDFTYANNKLTITRADAVNSLAANDDDIVVLSVDKSTGDATITGAHAKKGPASGYTGGQATDEISAFGDSITIKVPKLSVDAYGHTNSAEDVEYKITLPTPEAATNTVTLLTKGAGIDIEELATDGNHNYKVSHANTSDAANLIADGRKYVTGLTFDDFGHVTGYTTGTEVDQNLSNYKIKQTAVNDKDLTGANVLGSLSQNANGEITYTVRALTAADLGLDTVMHFIGAYTVAPTKAFAGSVNERDLTNGDVYLNTANATEYVYSNNKWVELGNEEGAGSHALKTITITGNNGLTGGGALDANRTIGIATDGVTTSKIADKNVTEEKLEQDVQDALALARTALQEHQPLDNYKTKQQGYEDNFEKGKSQIITSLTQNINGEIAYSVVELTHDRISDWDETVANTTVKLAVAAEDADRAYKDQKDNIIHETYAKKVDVLNNITAGTGLTVSAKANNTQEISFNDDVIFVLNANF